jgi:hypothetical protein
MKRRGLDLTFSGAGVQAVCRNVVKRVTASQDYYVPHCVEVPTERRRKT